MGWDGSYLHILKRVLSPLSRMLRVCELSHCACFVLGSDLEEF